MSTERFDVNLTLKAQRSGEAAFAETEAGLKVVRKAVQNFSEAQANGLAIGEAYKESIAAFKRDALEAGLSFEAEATAIRDATRAIDRFRENEAAGLPFDEAVTAATEENTAATEEQATATEASTAAASGGIPAWIAWGAAIGSVALVIWPFIAAITTAVVAMISWVVAGAAAVILLAGMTIGFAALGLTLVALANHFRDVDPAMKVFTEHLNAIGREWAKRAAPAVNELLGFMTKLLPAVHRTGDSLVRWFAHELPKVLAGISRLIKDLSPDFIVFAHFMATAFDKAGPILFKFFEIMTRGGLGAVEGLTTNLMRLANWFNKESPHWAPIFNAIGRTVQWVADLWAKFNDWLISVWPSTMSQVQQFIDGIKKGWDKWGPLIETLTGLVMQFVQQGMQAILDHSEVLIPLLLGIALNFLAIIAVLAIVTGAFLTAADAIANFLSNTDNQFVNWANSVIRAINHVIEGINRIPGVHIDYVALIPVGPTGTTASNQFSAGSDKNHTKPGKSPTGKTPEKRHGGGDVEAGESYLIGRSGSEELFVPEQSGRIYPLNTSTGQSSSGSSSSGTDMTTTERLLRTIEDHLNAIRMAAPGITAAAATRRSG